MSMNILKSHYKLINDPWITKIPVTAISLDEFSTLDEWANRTLNNSFAGAYKRDGVEIRASNGIFIADGVWISREDGFIAIMDKFVKNERDIRS